MNRRCVAGIGKSGSLHGAQSASAWTIVVSEALAPVDMLHDDRDIHRLNCRFPRTHIGQNRERRDSSDHAWRGRTKEFAKSCKRTMHRTASSPLGSRTGSTGAKTTVPSRRERTLLATIARIIQIAEWTSEYSMPSQPE